MSKPAVAHPSAPEPDIPGYDLNTIPDTEEDKSLFPKLPLSSDGWSPLALGCATFGYGIYAPPPTKKEEVEMPLRVVRSALRNGISVFDTSPHYHPSEIVLGNCLEALAEEYPRNTYKIITKCGQYASDGFDYSPSNIEASVRRSLNRLKTTYLDVVYLHDVEFIASSPDAATHSNFPISGLRSPEVSASMGLAGPNISLGPGDDKVIAAFAVLQSLQAEGVIKYIGISGYPLPVLLRLSRLLPVQSLLSYSHSNISNSAFLSFLPHFPPTIEKLLTASPMNMGLLAPAGPPMWHPARSDPSNDGLVKCAEDAIAKVKKQEWEGGIVDVALGFGLRNPKRDVDGAEERETLPVVVGVTNLVQLHDSLKVWWKVNGEVGEDKVKREEVEALVRGVFVQSGWADRSWSSPPVKRV